MGEIVFSNIPVNDRVIHPNVLDSLIVPARLLSSLPIILKLSRVVTWPLLFWCRNIGDGAFNCSLTDQKKQPCLAVKACQQK